MKRFRIGQWVAVLNTRMSGTIFLEGKAVIVRAIDPEDNRYLVRFPDGTAVERYIDPMAQSPDVAFYVANLNDRKE